MYAYFDVDERTVLRVRQLIREGKAKSARDDRVARVAGPGQRRGLSPPGDDQFRGQPGQSQDRHPAAARRVPQQGRGALPRLLRPRPRAHRPPHQALLVTDRAIDNDQGQKILYVVNDKNEVVSRPVRVGALHDGLRAIEDGLKPGERVIVNGLQQVRPGVTVEPKLVDMPVAPAARGPAETAQVLKPADSDPEARRNPERRPVMLARFFIDRPVLAWVISLVIVLLGAIAAAFLPIAEYPEITPPTVQVTASYPGANAQVVADTVAAPIEQQVIGVEGMLYMSSQSNNDGSYTLDVTFELGTDVNMAQVLVQNRVAIAEPTLPEVVRAIGVTVKKRSPDILLVVNLYSEDNPETGRPYYDQLYLSNYATIQLKDALARVEGVGDVLIFGQQDYSMRVWLDPDKLQSRNLTAGDVIRVLREQNVQVAAGQIGQPPVPQGQDFQYTLSTLGRLVEAEQFADIILKTGTDGEVTYLKDVSPDRAGGPEPGHALAAGRQAVGRPRHLPAARLERPGHRRRHQGQDAGAGSTLPQGAAATPSSTTPRRSSASR